MEIPIFGPLPPPPPVCSVGVGPDHVRAKYVFEWHRLSRKVYVIHLAEEPKQGWSIAEDVSDHGQAIKAAQCWVRGYLQWDREGKDEAICQLTKENHR